MRVEVIKLVSGWVKEVIDIGDDTLTDEVISMICDDEYDDYNWEIIDTEFDFDTMELIGEKEKIQINKI